MGSLKLAAFGLLLGGAALAQDGPTYGIGRIPSADEIRALDISIGPNGAELPPGKGTAAEGAVVYVNQGCVTCHGEAGVGGLAPILKSARDPKLEVWAKERILPLRAPQATVVWDYIRRGMPLGREGTLTNNEVYALTAYLLVLNGVIPENTVVDQKNLAVIKMPIGDHYGRVQEWKPNEPRLKGYPY